MEFHKTPFFDQGEKFIQCKVNKPHSNSNSSENNNNNNIVMTQITVTSQHKMSAIAFSSI
jgi:hypothetical protein